MSTFFEKLKKGMEVEKLPPQKTIEEKAIEDERKKREVEKVKKPRKEIKVAKRIEISEDTTDKERENQWLQPEGQLTIDVYQTAQEIVIQSAIAGIKPEDLDISIENDIVIIKGSRERPIEKDERNYFYQECYWGPFSREIVMPEEFDNSKIEASMKEGILTIRMPKIEREKEKKVIVRD